MNPILVAGSVRRLSNYEITEIKNGAYVFIEDNGDLYNKYANEGVQRFYCEHNSNLRVYDIDGVIDNRRVGNVLIGTRQNGSWLQWERSKCFSVGHFFDWVLFVFTKKNQGPFGNTNRTENHAIIIKKSLNFKPK